MVYLVESSYNWCTVRKVAIKMHNTFEIGGVVRWEHRCFLDSIYVYLNSFVLFIISILGSSKIDYERSRPPVAM